MRIIWFLLFSALSVAGYVRLQNEYYDVPDDKRYATIAIRIGQRGIDFFSAIANKIMENEIPRVNFPPINFPITGGPGSGKAKVKDLKVRKFKSPDFTFTLQPPDRIILNSTGGAVKIRGNWSAEYQLLTKLYIGGWVEAIASNIVSRLTVSIYGESNRPQVSIVNCQVDIGYFFMQIGGGVIPWLINLFHSDLSDLIKAEIHQQFCTTARTTLIDALNQELLLLPSRIPVVLPIYVEYEYTNNPVIENSEIVYSAYLDVIIGNSTCGSLTPYSGAMPPLEPPQPLNPLMTTIWIAPTVFQCLANSVHAANLAELVIDENFDGGKFATFLRAKCAFFEVCLGKFLPKFAIDYPDARMALHFHTTRPADVFVKSKEVMLNTETFVDFHISTYYKDSKILARIDMKANLSVEPQIINDRIGGVLNKDMDLRFDQVFSTIGDIHESVLNLFATMFGPVLRIMVDAKLRIGLPIPQIEDIAVSDGARFSALANGVMRIDADFYSK